MSEPIMGCALCRDARPEKQVTDHPDGSRTIEQACPDCGTIWMHARLTRKQVVALATTKVAPELLRRFASAIEGSSGASYQDVIDEVAIIHGEDTAQALREVLAALRASENASLTASTSEEASINAAKD